MANANTDNEGLALLRAPFPAHQVSKLPKPTKDQTEKVRADFKLGVRCQQCGAWHHKDVVHLDYVGHAALTDRLLDADPHWSWEPVAFREGLPAFDGTGGLWIKLTVCGVTRLGYGHAATKPNADPGSREKEVIGDALRNAAMRFGAALDLWHKGDLHVSDEEGEKDEPKPWEPSAGARTAVNTLETFQRDPEGFKAFWNLNKDGLRAALDAEDYAWTVENMKRIAGTMPKPAPKPEPVKSANGHQAAVDALAGDEIPF